MDIQDQIFQLITTPVEPGHFKDGAPLPMRKYKQPLPEGLEVSEVGLDLSGYKFPLPSTLRKVDVGLLIGDYKFPLPDALEEVGGWLYLKGYDFALPKALRRVVGLDLSGYQLPLQGSRFEVDVLKTGNYKHQLPVWIYEQQPSLLLRGFRFPLPPNTTDWRRELYVDGYLAPLPSFLQCVRGNLVVREYKFALPVSLSRVDGSLWLQGYKHPLPKSLAYVGSVIWLTGYTHLLPHDLYAAGGIGGLGTYKEKLPESLKYIGDIDGLQTYKYPLPSDLQAIGASEPVVLTRAKHPLPDSVREVRSSLVLKGYPFPLPQSLEFVYGVLSLNKYKFPLPNGLRAVGAINLGDYGLPMPPGLVSVAGLSTSDGVSTRVWRRDRALKPGSAEPTNAPPMADRYTPGAQFSAPEFKKWFKKSLAADAGGKPIIVYHGTKTGGHAQFDLSKIDPHQTGFFFTDNISVADSYVGNSAAAPDPVIYADSSHADGRFLTVQRRENVENSGYSGIYRVVLSIQKPLIVDAQGGGWNAIRTPEYGGPHTTYQIAALAKGDGYDGVIFRNILDEGGETRARAPQAATVYTVFKPTQIKSAFFNNSKFSSRNPDLRKNAKRTSRAPVRKTSKRAKRKTSRRR